MHTKNPFARRRDNHLREGISGPYIISSGTPLVAYLGEQFRKELLGPVYTSGIAIAEIGRVVRR